MATSRSQRLEPVRGLARNRERSAAAELGSSQRTLHDHQQRLQELLRYRDDYSHRVAEAAQAGMGAGRLCDYRLFLARLDQAVDQQRNLVVSAQSHLDERRGDWVVRRTQTKAMEKVVGNLKREEDRLVERREQHLQDEWAMRPRRERP